MLTYEQEAEMINKLHMAKVFYKVISISDPWVTKPRLLKRFGRVPDKSAKGGGKKITVTDKCCRETHTLQGAVSSWRGQWDRCIECITLQLLPGVSSHVHWPVGSREYLVFSRSRIGQSVRSSCIGSIEMARSRAFSAGHL